MLCRFLSASIWSALLLVAASGTAHWIDPTEHAVRTRGHGQRALAFDVNGDLSQDLVCSYSASDEVVLELNNGDGTGWTYIQVGSDIVAMYAEAALIDNDGKLDIVAVGLFDRDNGFQTPGLVAWYEQGESINDWTEHVIDDTLIHARYLGIGNIDGDDGDLDIAVISQDDDGKGGNGNKAVWYEQTSNATFSAARLIADGLANPEGMSLVQLDADDELEIFIAEWGGNRVLWYDQDATPGNGWTEHLVANVGGPTSVKPYDMDGDLDLDVLVAAHDAGLVVWYERPIDPTTSPWDEHQIASVANAVELVRADFDNDGDLDIAVGAADWGDGTGSLEMLENQGSDTYNAHSYDYFWMTSVDAADIDGDGDLDTPTASYGGDRVDWWENKHPLFADGFESGDTEAWSSVSP